MALTPFSPGHQSTVFDSFFLDVWDPSKDLPFFFSAMSIPSSNMGAATTQFAAIHIDWTETQEAHVFRANLPGMRKEEIKVEVDGTVVCCRLVARAIVITKSRVTTGTVWKGAAAGSCAGSAYLRTPRWSESLPTWRTACSLSPCRKKTSRSGR